jgi:hypothetical protein
LWQDEDFGYTIPKAIGLLVFVLDGAEEIFARY